MTNFDENFPSLPAALHPDTASVAPGSDPVSVDTAEPQEGTESTCNESPSEQLATPSVGQSADKGSINLDLLLRAQIKALLAKERDSLFELCGLASKIRSQHLLSNGQKYDDKFRGWWRRFKIHRDFGNLSNFTKYALAGTAHDRLTKLGWPVSNIPVSGNALYEIAQLTDEELALCLVNTYRRQAVTSDQSLWSSKTPAQPLISVRATANDIHSWRDSWRNPKPTDSKPKRPTLLTITVDESFLQLDDSGKYIGETTKGMRLSGSPRDLASGHQYELYQSKWVHQSA